MVLKKLAVVLLAGGLGACSQTKATAQTIVAEGSTTDLFIYLASATKAAGFATSLAKSSSISSGDFIQQMFASVSDAPGEFAGKAYINLKKKLAAVQSESSAFAGEALPASIGNLITSAGTLDRSAAEAYVSIANQANDLLAGRAFKGNLAEYGDLKKALHVALALTAVQGFDCLQVKISKNNAVPCYRDTNAQIGFYLITNVKAYQEDLAAAMSKPEAAAPASIGKATAAKTTAVSVSSHTDPSLSNPAPALGSGFNQTIEPASGASLEDGSTTPDYSFR